MKYKFELSIVIAVIFGLSLTGVASANSVTKTLYVDGVKVGTASTTQAISFPYPRLTIGAEGSRYYCYSGLVGEIDEFAVYGYVLTDANVAAHFNAAPAGYRAAVNGDHPLLYLQFEDANSNQGSKAANSGSAADMNITYIGAVGQDAGGYIGKAAVLHGANGGTGDCVDVCDYGLQLSTTNVSVEFWLKTTQNSDYPRFFQHNGGNTEQHSYGAMYSAETNAVGLIGGGSTGYITKAINDNAWHHIVVTFNSISPGPYAAEVMADDPCVYLKFDNPMPVDSSSNHYWAGYSVNAKTKPVGGAIGSRALYCNNSASLGSGNQGRAYVWNNGDTPTPFRSGPGFTNRWGPEFAFTLDAYGNFAPEDTTYEFWMKSDPTLTPDTYAILFQQIDGMSWDSGTNGPVKEPNAPGMGLYTDGATGLRKLRVLAGSQWWYPGTNAPLDGQWHQIVVTYDQNENNLGHDMGLQLYVDGSLAASTTIVDPNGNARLGPNFFYVLQIGCEQNIGMGTNCFGGYVDEFAVYSGVLSANRIAAHYAAWQPKNCAEVIARGLTLPGDLNGDCQVDIYDFAIFASQWHLCDNPGTGCPPNW
ncbi:MAG: LamG-like jellyroll fold domain-containing protein [Sedimentisphaerales bacterium]